MNTEILAGIHYLTQAAARQRAGGKGPKPKMIPRPKDQSEKTLSKYTPMDLDDLDALIGWESPRNRE